MAAGCNGVRAWINAPRRRVSIVMLLFTIVGGCTKEAPIVVARMQSSDGAYDAVIARVSGGATSPWDVRVYIVQHGVTDYADQNQVFGATHVDSLLVAWRDPNTLTVSYQYANIYLFKNVWWKTRARTVEVRLAPTIENSIPPKDRAP